MKWISVEDRLPEIEGEYLVSVEEFNSETFNGFSHYLTITKFGKRVIKTIYEENKIIHLLSDKLDFEVNDYDRDIKVEFWAPLPELPWKKE